jgi:hypothetical protein
VALIRVGLTRENRADGLRAAVGRQRVDDPGAELIEIIEERYDMFKRVWPLLLMP